MFHSSSLRKEVSSNQHKLAPTNSEFKFKNSAFSEVCLPLSKKFFTKNKGNSSQSVRGALLITSFKPSGFLSLLDKKLFSTLSSSPDTELLALFRSSCIIDNLNESILKLCQNNKIFLKSDLPPVGVDPPLWWIFLV